MIERADRTNPPQRGLEPVQNNLKKTLTGRTFHQILTDSITERSLDSSNKPEDNQNSSLAISDKKESHSLYEKIIHIVFRHEGKGLVKDDAGRESSKFGILESTARQYGYKGDMSSMTKDDAERIYKKLWEKSGAGDLPYPLSLVHFDTYVNSPAAARRFLAQSGGDVDVYLDLRQKRYDRLIELRPERFARYQKGWANRINNLKALVMEERLSNLTNAKPSPFTSPLALYGTSNKGNLLF